MSKYTIEVINGVPHTLITVNDAGNWELQEADKIIDWRGVYVYIQGKYTHPLPASAYIIGYALPPLPRNPTADDAKLLHLYAAHGLFPQVDTVKKQDLGFIFTIERLHHYEITHAIDEQGNRVEIAIID